jgi:hypothetical protein
MYIVILGAMLSQNLYKLWLGFDKDRSNLQKRKQNNLSPGKVYFSANGWSILFAKPIELTQSSLT